MSKPDDNASRLRRYRRAEKTRARWLSPGRIVGLILWLPCVAFAVGISAYVRTSPFAPHEAVAHLIARGGCDAASFVGLAPAYRGEPGYHARNDPDGDGIACGSKPVLAEQSLPRPVLSDAAKTGRARRGETRFIGGAKFVRP